jgi:hypothetical protein
MCCVCSALCVRQMSFMFHNFLTFVLISRQFVRQRSLRLAPQQVRPWVLQVDSSAWLTTWNSRGLSGWLVSLFPWWFTSRGCLLLAHLSTLLLAHPLARSWVVMSALLVVLLSVLKVAHQWVPPVGSPVGSPVDFILAFIFWWFTSWLASGLSNWFSTCSHPCCLAY